MDRNHHVPWQTYLSTACTHGLPHLTWAYAVEDMVKNKGFLPSGPSEIPIQRNQIKDIIYSLYPACKEPDLDSGIPFRADAIIANPPAYVVNGTELVDDQVFSLPQLQYVHNHQSGRVSAGLLNSALQLDMTLKSIFLFVEMANGE
ncbi:unnamed protein product [Thlaspi arvense]|uniref:Uncharacterized protein n=1 Tax=Thlaspi arvense TaxID=13288 RepID=A0AAU9RRA1_THLAR|nr:unnamed protein product [Thlaspi arvense]